MRAALALSVLAACTPPSRAPRYAFAPLPAAASATPAACPLPAPHRLPPGAPLPALHVPTDLRALVGRRVHGAPLAVALAWQAAFTGTAIAGLVDGATLVAHAAAAGVLAPPTAVAAPGDLLVFDRTDGTGAADLVAVAIARDRRGVTEYTYVAGGVVRRGFVDASRPALRRDAAGATVNTYLRAGRREPPRGTHYLAGELLAHVIHR